MFKDRRLLWGSVALIVAALLVWGLRPAPQWADLQPVRKGPLVVSVTEEGETRLRDRFIVSAPVDGYLLRHKLEVGDALQVGQPLLTLEPSRSAVLDPRTRAEAGQQVEAAKAELSAAKQHASAATAEAERAASNYQRLERLSETGAVSEDLLEEAAAQLRVAQANERSARARIDTSRYQLQAAQAVLRYSAARPGEGVEENIVLSSPIAGNIVAIHRRSEGPVVSGEYLLELGNPEDIEVYTDVLSADAVRIKPGTTVWLHHWGGEQPLPAVVSRVEPVGFTKVSALGVEEQRVWVVADINAPAVQWGRLGVGYRVESRFIISQRDDALLVPQSAIFERDDGHYVYRLDSDRARLAPVKLGLVNGLDAQILSGLSLADEVIASPSNTIEDGARIRSRL